MLNIANKYEKIGVLTSFIIGLPIGLTPIFLTMFAPTAISGEGLPTIGLIAVYGYSIIGLIMSFIYALWYAGRKIVNHILSDKSLLFTSYYYSITVNKIIWTVFLILTIFQNLNLFSLLFLIPPIIAFVLCVCVTTVSIGLIICGIAQILIKNEKNKIDTNN